MRSVELDVSSEWTSRYSSQRIDIVTPGRFISRARAVQSGSARRRWPCATPARPNSRASRASSVTSSASGHASPAAAARFRLSWIVERATPRRRPISRALTLSWCSRNKCRSCRMLSSRFAGIPVSSSTIDGPGVPQLANRGEQTTRAVTGSGGRLHLGMVAGIKSERWPTSNRHPWPECVGIRRLAARLTGKTAAETISAMLAVFGRIDPHLRRSITFDNDTAFAQHGLLRTMRDMTTWFCDAYASWQKGGVENANGRLRRWLPRHLDIDRTSDQDIQEIVLTTNLTPRKCLGFKTPFQALLAELGKDVQICFS